MNNAFRLVCAGVLALGMAGCVGPLERPSDEEQDAAEAPEVDTTAAAVVSLIDQARLAFEQGDFQGAIASAERGLRIDRREPELYLVLAQSYMTLAQPEQARQFARQGLRFSPPDSHLYQALETVHDQAAQNTGTLRF
ncbi:tetratricopeptide repeat protein [Marinimicrobium sp. ARAG 43.8]|uniref:tetratricopeptide repeat protein n=1 Tax=Marinimicrobium sp. ARAG 43.8 TaxID=3418719 RepID=UPI003CE99165